MARRIGEFAIWSLLALLGLFIAGHNSLDAGESWNSGKYQEEAEQTFELIFHKYHRFVRPPQEYVNISVEMTVERLKYLDVMKEELQTVVVMEMTWFDSRLSWTPIRVDQIMSNLSSVWIPDLVFLNSVAPSQSLLPKIVRIKKNGYVAWTRKEVVTTSCETEPKSERQTCYLRLGFMTNIHERQSDRFIDQDNSKLFSSGNLNTHEWDLDTESLYFKTDNNTFLPYEMGAELTVQRPESEGGGDKDGNSEGDAQCTGGGCPSNYRNSAESGQRLFAQARRSSALLFIHLLVLMHPLIRLFMEF